MSSGFTELIEEYGAQQVVYGHLHGREAFKKGIKGERAGAVYALASADYLDFKPLRIIPAAGTGEKGGDDRAEAVDR
jgi:predicted phosphohydrolase